MLTGSRSINQMFCTREIFNAVPPIQESMPKNALEDLTSCLNYSDDWDPIGDLDWDEVYDDPKVVAPPHAARHRVKHGILEDCYIQVCSIFVVVVVVVSNRLQPTFLVLLLLLLLTSNGSTVSTHQNGSQLMKVELQAGIIVP